MSRLERIRPLAAGMSAIAAQAPNPARKRPAVGANAPAPARRNAIPVPAATVAAQAQMTIGWPRPARRVTTGRVSAPKAQTSAPATTPAGRIGVSA